MPQVEAAVVTAAAAMAVVVAVAEPAAQAARAWLPGMAPWLVL